MSARIPAARVAEIIAALNAYEAAHGPEGADYDPGAIWDDVIIGLPEYDKATTDGFTDLDRFALTDGTVIVYNNPACVWQIERNQP